MSATARRSDRLKRQGHFPCEAEIARRLSQSEERWRQIAALLESQYADFPRKDPLMGGRYWPAVEAFFHHRARLVTVAGAADDERAKEDLSVL